MKNSKAYFYQANMADFSSMMSMMMMRSRQSRV